MQTAERLVAHLAGWRVLVVGDVTLDEYLFGRATRLSREAPIPVLELEERRVILGGAANPACNIVALGSHAVQVGIVGADSEGQQLREALQQASIDPAGLLTVAERPTTVKTRVLAHEPPRLPQQVARLDRLDRGEPAPALQARLHATLADLIPTVDAVLCSDYQLGLLAPSVVTTICRLCRQHHKLLTVDAQGNADYYQGVDLFRCNDREAGATLGRTLRHEADFKTALAQLLERLAARWIIVTRGPEGLSLQGADLPYTHLPATQLSEVYDTTGAGDTFIAVVTLGLSAGLRAEQSARLANAAAGCAVRKLGNAVVTPAELVQAMPPPHSE